MAHSLWVALFLPSLISFLLPVFTHALLCLSICFQEPIWDGQHPGDGPQGTKGATIYSHKAGVSPPHPQGAYPIARQMRSFLLFVYEEKISRHTRCSGF